MKGDSELRSGVMKPLLGEEHPFYEAWKIEADGTIESGNNRFFTPWDAYKWGQSGLENTRGKFKISGVFSFYPGASIPQEMQVGVGAGQLPKSKKDPKLGQPFATKKRWIEIEWDFCESLLVVTGKDSEGGSYHDSK